MWRIPLILPFFLLSFLLSTCKDMGTEPLGDGRIVLGESIEGIRLGDSPERVVELLGPPQYTGFGDASDRFWKIYYYDFSGNLYPHSFQVWFIGATATEPGMVDYVVVQFGYFGRSRDGIGVSSTLNDLKKVLGTPRRTVELPDRSIVYFCVKKTNMYFHVQADTVKVLDLGPLIPGQFATPCE